MRGYAGRTLRINLTAGRPRTIPLDASLARQFLGGRGFNSCNMYRELAPGIDPLSPRNTVYISTGPLVGTMFPTASRFNISAKSPQTGILGDSNAGGHLAAEMKYAGYDQVILEGRSPDLVYVFIDDGDVSLRDASRLKGRDVYETDRLVKEDVGDDGVQTLVVGPAAENGVKYAGVFVNLMRVAARTGLGTVLSSKGVKALAFRGTGSVEVAHYGRFMRLVDEVEEMIYGNPQYGPRRRMGTTRILMMANTEGFLPTRNYTAGVFEDAEQVSGERLAEDFNVKTRGCYACTIPCSRFYVVREGRFAGLCGEGPEYESLGSFTSRIGNGDLGLALKANDMCNRLGLDALSTSGCIAFAMELHERGLLRSDEADGLDLSWGSPYTILALIEKIAYRKGFGDVLADGSKAAADKLGRGHMYAMQVKGLDIIMADPRGLKGFGLGYAVASRGGDHLRSEPFLELSDDPSIGERMFGVPEATLRLADRGKGKLVSYFEDWNAVIDALEPCKNIMQNMEILTFERASEVIEVATGMKLSAQEVRLVGSRIVTVERAFNSREGLAREDDSIPPRFLEERLTEGPSSGTVFDLKGNLDEYYAERRWDRSTGNPTREALIHQGLEWVADDLERLGVLEAKEVKD
ncbi:aldehyde ferredoxin oxidoreductase family protein [Candidatus Bathyarchaeota archaeon]|nr:aldehyde ferredoxin oxidoreductase family protein [Candidatus Bathyarchaeota archaeon]